MSEIRIYVEGGGDSKEMRARCREGFHKLLEKSGFKGRVPRIIPCGGRENTFDDFKTAHREGKLSYVAMIVDSEDPVSAVDKVWEHLKSRAGDEWDRPSNATDDQVFLMTTCMETWIVADRASMDTLYRKDCLQASALPPMANLEQRNRHDVQDRLVRATARCSNAYKKGKRSFDALANVNPDVLRSVLPSFERMIAILERKL